MLYVLPITITLAELIWSIAIGYPPSLEQAGLGLTDFSYLWLIRGLGLLLLAASAFCLSTFLNLQKRKYYWAILSAIPLFYLVILSYPLDALKVFLISLITLMLIKLTGKKPVTVLLIILSIFLINIPLFGEKPGIIEDISIKSSQEEVTLRFNIEDNVSPNIKLPLTLRRIGYNKYFIVLKNVSQEFMGFWDTETIFFQEVHPMGQKAFVIFFWPYIFIFFAAVYYLTTKNRDKNFNWNFVLLFSIALSYYLSSSASADRRHIFTAFLLVFIFTESIFLLLNRTKSKFIVFVLTALIGYGWLTNYYDRFIRPEYWLDNKPVAYDFAFRSIKENGLSGETVYFSETLFAAKKYCPFYLDNCNNIHIKDFNFTNDESKENAVYVGFTGNFVGLKNSGFSENEIKTTLAGRNIKVFATKQVLNNIASGYGQTVIVAKHSK